MVDSTFMLILSMIKSYTSLTPVLLIQKGITPISNQLKQLIELSSIALRKTKRLSNLVIWITKQSKKEERTKNLLQANVFRLSLFILLLMNIQNLYLAMLSLRQTSKLIKELKEKTNLIVRDLFLILGVSIFLCQMLNESTIGSTLTKETMARQLSRMFYLSNFELLSMSKLKIFKI